MRWLALLCGLLLSVAVAAQTQDAPKKKKKPAVKQAGQTELKGGRQKPTPEQIRRFNELQKKK